MPLRPTFDLQKGATMEDAKKIIRDVPDFPKKGIIFKDITPLLGDPVIFQKTINTMKKRYLNMKVDVVVGVEARGFIFASALAYALGIVKYRYGAIRLDDNGTLAILGLIFLSSMALRFVRNFIFEHPPENEPDTLSKEGQVKTRP